MIQKFLRQRKVDSEIVPEYRDRTSNIIHYLIITYSKYIGLANEKKYFVWGQFGGFFGKNFRRFFVGKGNEKERQFIL